MKTRLTRMIITIIGMFFCAGLAVILPLLWGSGGRDVRPQATIMAILVLFLASVLRRCARWTAADFMFGLIAVEIITLCVIGNFSGFTRSALLHPFNLEWLAFMNLPIAFPWIVGYFIGGMLSGRNSAT